MVNVDFSPALVLGLGMIAGGLGLSQMQRVRPWLSRDFDLVMSCVAIFSGGILVFQGWRLDPILFFGQLLTAGSAVAFAVEALRLRSVVSDQEERMDKGRGAAEQAPASLPQLGRGLPAPHQSSFGRWSGADDAEQDARTWLHGGDSGYAAESRWQVSDEPEYPVSSSEAARYDTTDRSDIYDSDSTDYGSQDSRSGLPSEQLDRRDKRSRRTGWGSSADLTPQDDWDV
ncbi:hypothetical protein WJX72_006160 [[Myrmecia] bisecta]|uniref:Ycf66 n=1 Tax=[Myrmecia] bisecta TaxID=41462 RepID=A0AAW1R811_9CHLO